MGMVAVIGFLLFFGALIYLIYYVISKILKLERKFSKKMFFPLFFGGLLLLIIGVTFNDTSSEEKLESALEEIETLSKENKKLRSAIRVLKTENSELHSKLEDENKVFEDNTASLEKEIEVLKEKNTELTNTIDGLNAKNTELTSEINHLKSEIASNSTLQTSGSSSGYSTTSSNTTAVTSTSSTEWFNNCTELRSKYPNGVSKDHPAYQSKLDWDHDGWACER